MMQNALHRALSGKAVAQSRSMTAIKTVFWEPSHVKYTHFNHIQQKLVQDECGVEAFRN